MSAQIFNLEMAIVNLNSEIFEAEYNDQPQTAAYLKQKVESIKDEIKSIKTFRPLFS